MDQLPGHTIFSEDLQKDFERILEQSNADMLACLVDENTKESCLPHLSLPDQTLIIEIKSGESEKTLSTCEKIWSSMTEASLSRKSLLLNLGGGVIGDMGGFVASTYKRGIPFINFPTTLLAQVDASSGGKLGVDFQGLKNHIGVFNDPKHVVIYPEFLKTLPENELRSGFAEVIKHGLIWDDDYFNSISKTTSLDDVSWIPIIKRSIQIKNEVVSQDPLEKGLRKILNFGHTLGHAVEAWHLNQKTPILHGEAVAIGMIMESFLSYQQELLSNTDLETVVSYIRSHFEFVKSVPSASALIPLMIHDKKNEDGLINFSILDKIGHCRYDEKFTDDQISGAVSYYRELK